MSLTSIGFSYFLFSLDYLAFFSRKNFIILIAKRFLKKKTSEYVLEDKSDLRFNQIIATVLLSASLISSITNHPILAIIFAAFVFLAASIALSGFCIGCWIHFQLRQYKYRRQAKKGLH
ncbi:DUF4395 family protein [Lactococcus lactis]|uniref:DUF4395 family protein n=1 Tax=Lactococcus lactis TaxID=1358 RepID=UPI0013E91BB9|nr:DUF4395 family protein [Lactococcus lactis]